MSRPIQLYISLHVITAFYFARDVFLSHHHISELPRLIVVKLCHMIGNRLNFVMQVQKFGERCPPPPLPKKRGQKHAKFRSILSNLIF